MNLSASRQTSNSLKEDKAKLAEEANELRSQREELEQKAQQTASSPVGGCVWSFTADNCKNTLAGVSPCAASCRCIDGDVSGTRDGCERLLTF